MALPPTRTTGVFARGAGYVRLGEGRQFFKYIKPSDVEAQDFLKTFLAAIHSADVSIDAAAFATRQLQKWVGQGLTKAEAQEFVLETSMMFREATYGRAAKNVRLGKYAEDIQLPKTKKNKVKEVEVPEGMWGAIASHFDELNVASDLLAFHAFQRMLGALGPKDEGWTKLMRSLAKHDKNMLVEEAERLRPILTQLETATGAEKHALLNKTKRARGIHSNIKGMLGEIYLARWPTLRAEMAEALGEARQIAAGMGEGWEAMHVVGNIKINRNEGYDQAVILVNREDQQVAIHTAIQMKVERELSAFEQIANDVRRERGLPKPNPNRKKAPKVKMAPPIGHFFEIDGNMKGFTFVSLPDGKRSQRYVYFAEGPDLGLVNDHKLKALGVEAKAMPIDLSVDSLNALALQIMLSAKKMK